MSSTLTSHWFLLITFKYERDFIRSEATLSGKYSSCPVLLCAAAFRISVSGNTADKVITLVPYGLSCLSILKVLGNGSVPPHVHLDELVKLFLTFFPALLL